MVSPLTPPPPQHPNSFLGEGAALFGGFGQRQFSGGVGVLRRSLLLGRGFFLPPFLALSTPPPVLPGTQWKKSFFLRVLASERFFFCLFEAPPPGPSWAAIVPFFLFNPGGGFFVSVFQPCPPLQKGGPAFPQWVFFVSPFLHRFLGRAPPRGLLLFFGDPGGVFFFQSFFCLKRKLSISVL